MNRIVYKIFRLYYHKVIKGLIHSTTYEVIHGDFHLNNVLVDKTRKVFLLDFESVKTGLQDIELAYMVAQIHQLKGFDKTFSKKVDALIDEMEIVKNSAQYKKILNIYKKAIGFNPRFS